MRKNLFIVALAAFAVALAAPAQAGILFDPDGAGPAGAFEIDVFDPTVGNSISTGLDGTSTVGSVGTLYFQANLGIATNDGSTVFADGISIGDEFTIVAAISENIEAITTDGTNTTLNFGFDGTVNAFAIYAQSGDGDNLTGACFVGDCGGTLVLFGTFINDATFDGAFTTNLSASGVALDGFGANNYPGVVSLAGNGSFSSNILVTFVDSTYFPDLLVNSSFLIATSQQRLPYDQANPSACFFVSSVGNPDCAGGFLGVGAVGSFNGLNGSTMLQTDASIAFSQPNVVPEPATLTMLGLGLLGAAAARRRQRNAKG